MQRDRKVYRERKTDREYEKRKMDRNMERERKTNKW